mgnify:CR=1 FL=1
MQVTKRFTVDATTWTAITVPATINANAVGIRESTGLVRVKTRTSDTDSTTEDEIPAGMVDVISPGSVQGSGAESVRAPFPASSRVYYAQSASGTVTVVARFAGREVVN